MTTASLESPRVTTVLEPSGVASIGHIAAIKEFGDSNEHDTAITATPQQKAAILFLSYRFSEDNNGAQQRMLLNIEAHEHPDLFRGGQYQEVKKLATSMRLQTGF